MTGIKQKTQLSCKDENTSRTTLCLVRRLYLVFGVVYVGVGMFGTMQKMLENRTVLSITEHEFSRFRFPSITFCYAFEEVGTEIRKIVLKLENIAGTYIIGS